MESRNHQLAQHSNHSAMDITEKRHVFSLHIIHHFSHWKELVLWLIHVLTHAERTYEGTSKNEPASFVSQQTSTVTDCLPTHQEYKGKLRFIQFKEKVPAL